MIRTSGLGVKQMQLSLNTIKNWVEELNEVASMRPLVRMALGVTVCAATTSFVATAQTVISAKSGLLHYVEGRVFLGDQLVESKFGNFPDIKENQELRTEEGRAEVLLTPGVFLRLGESSAIRLVTNRLIDTRVEFLAGSALLEADELLKDNGVTIVYEEYTVQLQKKGLYRFDSDPPTMRVYDGEVLAQFNGQNEEIKGGRILEMNGAMAMGHFDKDKETDELYLWSRRRSEYLAMANVSAAKSISDSGMHWEASNWSWNPYFNMFTFIPSGTGMFYSPFGYALWSPYNVYDYVHSYAPYYFYPDRLGYGGGGRTSPRTPRGVNVDSGAVARAATRSRLSRAATSSGGGVSGHGARGGGYSGSVSVASIGSGSHAGGGGGHR